MKNNIDLKKKIYMLSSYVKLVIILKASKRLLINLSMLKKHNDKKIYALIQCRACVYRYKKAVFKPYGRHGVYALIR